MPSSLFLLSGPGVCAGAPPPGTWLPLSLQVCINGREWLARQMQRAGITYQQKDNCFTQISDLRQALTSPAPTSPEPSRRVAARATRQLRLLRAHGLIYRVGRAYYYRLTQKVHEVMNTALKFRQTDVALVAT